MSASRPRIVGRRRAHLDEWADHYQADRGASFTQSPQWALMWSAASGGRIEPVPELLSFDDGSTAVLALVRERTDRGTLIRSGPAGTYGGWLSRDPLAEAHRDQLLNAMLTHRDLVWRVSPFVTLPQGVTHEADVTHLVDLRGGYDAVLARARSNQRGAARKGREEGVVCSRHSGRAAWSQYAALYQDSRQRWGASARPEHPPAIFDELSAHTGSEVQLWLATRDDGALAGAVLLRSPRHTIYWHGAANDEARTVGATPLLLFEAMRDSCDTAASWFDFNPSGGLPSVVEFKQRMGGMEAPSPVVRQRSLRTRVRARLHR